MNKKSIEHFLVMVSIGALSACGGGGSTGSASPNATVAPEVVAPVVQVETCPESVPRFTSKSSSIPNANLSISSTAGDRLLFKTPAASTTDLQVCMVVPTDPGYTSQPEAATALLGTNKISVNLRASGDFNVLLNKTVSLRKKNDAVVPAAELMAFHVVSYTQDATGTWLRTVLPTTVTGSGIDPAQTDGVTTYTASISSIGYYSIENN
jgi:hypothetical protein